MTAYTSRLRGFLAGTQTSPALLSLARCRWRSSSSWSWSCFGSACRKAPSAHPARSTRWAITATFYRPVYQRCRCQHADFYRHGDFFRPVLRLTHRVAGGANHDPGKDFDLRDHDAGLVDSRNLHRDGLDDDRPSAHRVSSTAGWSICSISTTGRSISPRPSAWASSRV